MGRARVLARRCCFTQRRNQTMERKCQHHGLGSGLRGRNPSPRLPVGPPWESRTILVALLPSIQGPSLQREAKTDREDAIPSALGAAQF
jgi:hypothetical protein